MISVLILSFVAGGLFTHGVPHFTKGVTGQKHATPFGKPTTAIQNVAWGWLNMAVAVIVWHFAPMQSHPRAAFVGAAAGVLLVGVTLAATWANSLGSKS